MTEAQKVLFEANMMIGTTTTGELEDLLFPMNRFGNFDQNFIDKVMDEAIEITSSKEELPLLDDIINLICDRNDEIFNQIGYLDAMDLYGYETMDEGSFQQTIDDCAIDARTMYSEMLTNCSYASYDKSMDVESFVINELKNRGDCVRIYNEDMYYSYIVHDATNPPPEIRLFTKEGMGGVYYGDCQQLLLPSLLDSNILKSGKSVCIYDFDHEEQGLLEATCW